VYGPPRLLVIRAEQDTLAERQAVRLDDGGIAVFLPDIAQRLGRIFEHLVPGCGDGILLHQILGKHLAAFQNRGVRPGAEGRDARRLEGVHHSRHQRIVRSHEHHIRPARLRERHDAANIGGSHVVARSVTRYAAISGRAEQAAAAGTLPQLADNGVLPSAAADNQNIQRFFHACIPPAGCFIVDQWWNRRRPLKAMTIP